MAKVKGHASYKVSCIKDMEALLPIAIGGTLCILALVGIGELLKELTTIATKKKA